MPCANLHEKWSGEWKNMRTGQGSGERRSPHADLVLERKREKREPEETNINEGNEKNKENKG